jgi:hypothetical protein
MLCLLGLALETPGAGAKPFEETADRLQPALAAIGRRLRFGPAAAPAAVGVARLIGIVSGLDQRRSGLGEDPDRLLAPLTECPGRPWP